MAMIPGLGIISHRGGISATLSNGVLDSSSVTDFTLSFSAIHGFGKYGLPPWSPIRAKLDFSVYPNGVVKLAPWSQHTAYPSFEVYSYSLVDGKIVTQEVHTKEESGDLNDLGRPMRRISGGSGGMVDPLNRRTGGLFSNWTSLDLLNLMYISNGTINGGNLGTVTVYPNGSSTYKGPLKKIN
jgi:hypothetical protein